MAGGLVGGVLIGGDIIDVVVSTGGGPLMVPKFGTTDTLVGSTVRVKALVSVVSVPPEPYSPGYTYSSSAGVGCTFDAAVSLKRPPPSTVTSSSSSTPMVSSSSIMPAADTPGRGGPIGGTFLVVVKVVGVPGKSIGVGGGSGVDVMTGVVGSDIGVVAFWTTSTPAPSCLLNRASTPLLRPAPESAAIESSNRLPPTMLLYRGGLYAEGKKLHSLARGPIYR